MNNKMKLLAGVLVFGSMWGFSEVIIGSYLNDMGLPSGVIMTGFFGMMFLFLSRTIFKRPGMQLGMGFVAGGLRLFNPFMGCHICSALAIMAEGALFEIIWYNISNNFSELRSVTNKVSMGIITAYTLYIGGYIITQILTPIVGGAGFYLENLIVFIPRILSSGLLVAFAGGLVLPILFYTSKLDVAIKDRLYYPTTLGISALCWIVVILFSIFG